MSSTEPTTPPLRPRAPAEPSTTTAAGTTRPATATLPVAPPAPPSRATPSAPPDRTPGPGDGGGERQPRAVARPLALAGLAVVAVVLGLLLFFSPYERGIVGDRDGSRAFVDTACAAPVLSVANGGSRAVDANGQWVSPEPPCQRSAAFRLGLGGLLVLSGAVAGVAARNARQEPAGRSAA
ncbi:MAG: hypothetical protein R2755_22390 [Acidimicrobiales bacterium]